MQFWKYQGAGNDFVLIDQRQHRWLTRGDTSKIAFLCDRRFGIGADGLILLQEYPGFDFEMVYFNADGRESTLCGNGGRCITAFAHRLGIQREVYRFWAVDGPHDAILKHLNTAQWVELKMNDVSRISPAPGAPGDFVLNTGSPHYVRFTYNLDDFDVAQEGRAIRNSPPFQAEGINVNFVETRPGHLAIRTYERGVEDETLACGTGVTAAALAFSMHENFAPGPAEVDVRARGGDMKVRFEKKANHVFSNIWLCGPAQCVFTGEIEI